MRFALLFLPLLVTACSAAEDASPATVPPAADASDLSPPNADPCAHLAGGPPGAATALADFSRAVGVYRFFGPGADVAPGELALARALATNANIDDAKVTDFARGLDGACHHAADARPLDAARVTVNGDVATIHPGLGDVVLPEGVARVAIDLRDLPQSTDLMPALERAFAASAKTGAALLDESRRECNGLPDEYFIVAEQLQNVYACTMNSVSGRALAAHGAADLPIALFTGATVAPDAALFAVALRARGRAWLLGEDVPAAVAESDWIGIGEAGIAVRTRTLRVDGANLPDLVTADVRTSDPATEWLAHAPDGAPPPLAGEAKRADFPQRTPPTALRAASDDPGDGRAAMVLAHATVSTFWPYFSEIPAPIDARLGEAMQIFESERATGRGAVRHALERFSEALSDGHSWVMNLGGTPPQAYAPIAVGAVGSEIVVLETATADVTRGETILAIDGEPIADVLARREERVSCSPHEKPSFASSGLFTGLPSPTVRVRALDGAERDVKLTGVAKPPSAFGTWDRPPGMLADLGAADVFYVSLDAYGAYPPSKLDLSTIDQGLAKARAVVLDVRGYPEAASWTILAKVIPSSAVGPAITMLDVTSRATTTTALEVQTLDTFGSGPQTFTGPVALIVGHGTQSQAEHLTTFFKSSKRGLVIGEQTSGANGNITGIQLPGGWAMSFTGMHVAHPDGTRFFGIGHVPDVVVGPTRQDIHDHHDAALAKAIEILAL